MKLSLPEPHRYDPGRVLTEEERRALEQEYTWPRPDRKLCRCVCVNDGYRPGKRRE